MKVVLLIWYSNKNFGFKKIESYFCQLCLKLYYKIQTNPFRICIRVQKCIEFHLLPYEIPQLTVVTLTCMFIYGNTLDSEIGDKTRIYKQRHMLATTERGKFCHILHLSSHLSAYNISKYLHIWSLS